MKTDMTQEETDLRAKLATAREEQREAAALSVESGNLNSWRACADFVRETPLEATPLADRIKALEVELRGTCAIAELNKALARVAELEAWQLAVADGLDFVNRAEGQDGYEVARPSVIVEHVREMERERGEATDRVAELEALHAANDELVGTLQDALSAETTRHYATAKERDRLKVALARLAVALGTHDDSITVTEAWQQARTLLAALATTSGEAP